MYCYISASKFYYSIVIYTILFSPYTQRPSFVLECKKKTIHQLNNETVLKIQEKNGFCKKYTEKNIVFKSTYSVC